tara:strand:- start:415 stop:831 length:417 start_codon:yes stop_codon:yes gene_type:complete
MNIDWTSFTPIASLSGGMCIGLAALILMLSLNRIMGVSGILSSFFVLNESKTWAVFFLIGVFFGPFVFLLITNSDLQMVPVSQGITFYIAAFLIGIGTSIGSGCTSGHGICGLSRLSLRSLTAVLTFLGTGVLSVYFY